MSAGMVLSITLEKIVGAGEPYFLAASSASFTSSLLVHSGLCGSSRETPHTEWEKESSVQLTAANMHTEHRVTHEKEGGSLQQGKPVRGGALQVPHSHQQACWDGCLSVLPLLTDTKCWQEREQAGWFSGQLPGLDRKVGRDEPLQPHRAASAISGENT